MDRSSFPVPRELPVNPTPSQHSAPEPASMAPTKPSTGWLPLSPEPTFSTCAEAESYAKEWALKQGVVLAVGHSGGKDGPVTKRSRAVGKKGGNDNKRSKKAEEPRFAYLICTPPTSVQKNKRQKGNGEPKCLFRVFCRYNVARSGYLAAEDEKRYKHNHPIGVDWIETKKSEPEDLYFAKEMERLVKLLSDQIVAMRRESTGIKNAFVARLESLLVSTESDVGRSLGLQKERAFVKGERCELRLPEELQTRSPRTHSNNEKKRPITVDDGSDAADEDIFEPEIAYRKQIDRPTFIVPPAVLMNADGNCGYRTVAHYVYGHQDYWPQVRSELLRRLRTNETGYLREANTRRAPDERYGIEALEATLNHSEGRADPLKWWGNEPHHQLTADTWGIVVATYSPDSGVEVRVPSTWWQIQGLSRDALRSLIQAKVARLDQRLLLMLWRGGNHWDCADAEGARSFIAKYGRLAPSNVTDRTRLVIGPAMYEPTPFCANTNASCDGAVTSCQCNPQVPKQAEEGAKRPGRVRPKEEEGLRGLDNAPLDSHGCPAGANDDDAQPESPDECQLKREERESLAALVEK